MLRSATIWIGGALVLAGVFLFGSASFSDPEKVDVCHVRGGSGKTQTLSIAAKAVAAHLAHGDTLGACSTAGDDDDSFGTGDDDDSFGTGDDDDSFGTGDDDDSFGTGDDDDSFGTGDDDDDSVGGKVEVCHVRGRSGKTRTLSIAAESVADHLAHGDTLGACP